MKDNVFQAFRKAIQNYVYVDDLSPRVGMKVKDLHAKNYYDMDRVENLVSTPSEEPMMEEEDGGI